MIVASWIQMAEAVPITYLGTLQSAVPVTDTVPNGGIFDPLTADFWRFTLASGTQLTITGHRLQADLDSSFWVFRGTFTDTDEFGLGLDTIASLAFADDDIPAPPGLDGPFSDPQVTLTLPAGDYTVAFVSHFSSGAGPFAYCLELNGPAFPCERQVPLPATLALVGLGAGMSGMMTLLRNRGG